MDLEVALRTIVEAIDPSAQIRHHNKLSGGLSYQLRRIDTDRGSFVLREASDMRAGRWGLPLSAEFALIAQLERHSIPAPRTRLFDDSGTVLKHPFAVYDYIEGTPLLHSDDPAAVGVAVADALLSIHDLPLSDLDVGDLPAWSDFAGAVVLTEPPVFDPAVDEELVRTALGEHWPPAATDQTTLLHGDFWPGNILADQGVITGLLDWENASVGDPAADVAVTRLDLLWTFGVRATSAFTTRYRTQRTLPRRSLAVWDLFAALRPAGDLHQWASGYPGLGRPDITYDTMQAGHRWFVAQALAALT